MCGFPPGDARENWAILRALSAQLGQTLPFDNLSALRAKMFEAAPHLGLIDEVPRNEGSALPAGDLGDAAFVNPVSDHYLTNPIQRASTVMAELSRLKAVREAQPMAAE